MAQVIAGTMPAIRQFIDSNSGKKVLESARIYEPPAMLRMNRDWKILHPKPKPRRYSSAISAPLGKWNKLPMTAPAKIPTPSPATQCMVEPRTCLQRVATYCSCSPGSGSRQPNTYKNAPSGPVYAVRSIKPQLRTGDSGVVRMSITTYNSDSAVRRNHKSITPSSILTPLLLLCRSVIRYFSGGVGYPS